VATLGTVGTIKMTPYKYSQFPKYILKRPWFLKPNSLRLYIYLLLEANYQDNYKSNNIPLLKNQLLTSSNSLEKALELTRQKVETALETLKKTGDIEIKTTNKYSIITLLFDNKQKTGEEASKEVLFIFSQLPKYIKTKNWFLKPKTLRLYIYLLSNKSYKKTLIKSYKKALITTLTGTITLEEDQLLTSINSLTKALKLTTKEIRTALKHLQETNDIAIKPTTKYSIITLLFEEEKEGKQKTSDEALAGLPLEKDKKLKYSSKGKNTQKNTQKRTGDEALAELTPQEDDSKIRAKTRAISKEEEEEDNNNNIYGDDFKEFYNNYPVQKTKVKGDEASSEKKYNSLRKNGVSKEELSNALANYKEEIKAKSWQQTKRVEGWLEKWENYKQEDYSKEIKEIKAKIIEIEPEATITADNKRINIVLPTFDKLLDCKTSIKNVIKPLCDNIGYQYYLQSNDNSNQL